MCAFIDPKNVLAVQAIRRLKWLIQNVETSKVVNEAKGWMICGWMQC